MTVESRRAAWCLLCVVASAAVAGLAAPSRPALAQKPDPPAGQPAPIPKNLSPGISACATCHSGADQRGVELFVNLYKSHEFVRLDESHTWRGQDVHSVAHLALSGPLGKQMGEDLGYDVTKAPQCLTCHAVDLTPSAPLPEKRFFATQGVNCNGCHGLKETWQVRHYREAADGSGILWRASPPAEKAEGGMADLRNPAVRARLCVSCHVGSPAEGKVVTHEMFSAGHPPLPPFELATFQEGEPRHWGHPTELPYFKGVAPDKTWPLYRFHPAAREVNRAREMAAGAVAALRAEAQKLLAGAEEAMKPEADGMDYACFDCYACHHELRSKSDRQTAKRPRDGRGGRPTVRKAAGTLASVFAESAAGVETGGLKSRAAGFEEKWAELRAAVASKASGRPKRVSAAAGDVIAWCDEFLKVVEECPQPLYTKEPSERALAALAAAAEDRTTGDPEAALCTSWAYLSLRAALNGPLPQEWLRTFSRAAPPGVRVGPYGTPEKGKSVPVPVPPRYGERMDWVAEFETGRFRSAFKSALEPR